MTRTALLRQKTPHQGRFLCASVIAVFASLALIGAWLAPNHYPPWTSFHAEAAAFAALVLFAAARIIRPEPLTPARGLLVLTAVLVGSIALQCATGQIYYSGDAWLTGLYVVGGAVAWSLGADSESLDMRTPAVVWFAWIIVAAAALCVAIAHMQWLRMETILGIFAAERGPEMRPFSNLGQPNHLATLMMMGVGCALLLRARGRIGAAVCVLLVVWFSWGLTLSESRSGLLSALCMGALACLKGRNAAIPRPRWIAAWIALLIALAAIWPRLNEALYLQEPRGALAALASRDSARLGIWKQCVAGIARSPWLGYGWRQSMVGQKAGAESVSGSLSSDYAHSIVLDAMLWFGVPLGLLALGAAAWWLVRLFRRLTNGEEVLLAATVVPIVVHSMVEFPFAYSYFLFPAMWVLGVLARRHPGRTAAALPATQIPGSRLLASIAVAVFAALCMTAAVDYLKAEEDYRVMRFELRNVGRTPDGYETPNLLLLTQLDELLKAGRIVPRPRMPESELTRMREVSRHFAWATLQLKYAVALALNGQPQMAEHEMHLLRSIYGDGSYEQARQMWRDMQAQYPGLATVRLP
jgi:hypothetical protein